MRRTAFAATLLLAAALPAHAGDAEIRSAQSAIEGQIRAFLSGDNEKAYGFASPGVRQVFPDLGSFMRMVTGAYQPLYKPQNWDFTGAEEPASGSVIQKLRVTGPDGKDYEALYVVERQPDGSWKITSVSLKGSPAVGA